ncbi:hypothetical protein [Nocardioides sp. SYSU D00038]|uniref:hypothetical protein n=1 Tax=Nocardioides sp. SYSU D00038 TaxID=2812554 RepID=UPI001968077C|nr:hypothetical protein [Nocardioides sp. SYSU D00038]
METAHPRTRRSRGLLAVGLTGFALATVCLLASMQLWTVQIVADGNHYCGALHDLWRGDWVGGNDAFALECVADARRTLTQAVATVTAAVVLYVGAALALTWRLHAGGGVGRGRRDSPTVNQRIGLVLAWAVVGGVTAAAASAWLLMDPVSCWRLASYPEDLAGPVHEGCTLVRPPVRVDPEDLPLVASVGAVVAAVAYLATSLGCRRRRG